MAGTTKDMSQIKQLLLAHKQGLSNRKAALAVGINKETANKYIRMAEEDELPLDELLALPDPILEYRFKGGNPAYSDPRFELLRQNLDYYREQLKMDGVTMKLLWEEYHEGHELDHERYELTQFRLHLNRLLEEETAKRPSTILKDLYVPGEKIFFDYAGDQPEYTDMETGVVVRCQCFVACLPCSDYCYVECVPSQRAEDFIHAIQQCMKHLGGVPKIWVPDNLKAAVVKCDRYEPKINKMLDDMANHYGAVISPARPLHPKDKSQVEGQVKIIYQRIYAPLRNRKFYSLKELNDAFHQQMVRHNQKRMTNVPYSREEQFLAMERNALQALPDSDFEIRCYTDLRVQSNGCILLGRDKHWYSVPYQHIGSQVRVIYTRTMVNVYHQGEQIASHVRNYKSGGYSTLESHMASHCVEYRSLSAQTYINRAARVNPLLETVIRIIFTQNAPLPEETFFKGCEGLLSLQRHTDPVIFNKACQTAIDLHQCRYSFIKEMVRTKCSGIEDKVVSNPPLHANVRGKEQFQ